MGQRTYTFDKNLVLSDGLTAITATGTAVIGGVTTNSILDVGAARLDGQIVIDISAMDISSSDETYRIILQGSNSSSFASGIENLAVLDVGATAARLGGAQNSVIGRYELGFTNEQADTVYRYLRIRVVVAGITPTITFGAFIATDPGC